MDRAAIDCRGRPHTEEAAKLMIDMLKAAGSQRAPRHRRPRPGGSRRGSRREENGGLYFIVDVKQFDPKDGPASIEGSIVDKAEKRRHGVVAAEGKPERVPSRHSSRRYTAEGRGLKRGENLVLVGKEKRDRLPHFPRIVPSPRSQQAL